jgi:cobyrinic acid a,c-diamide synthase
LGLVAAEHGNVDEATLDALADAYVVHIDAKSLVAAAKMVGLAAGQGPARSTHPTFLDPPGVQRHIRLGIARDAAFSFYYPDNLEMLTGAGAELTPFSPLDDSELPADLDGIYFGGGYPEVHAEQLAANAAMRAAVANFAASGGAIYAECGGLMYLGRSLKTLDGSQFPMTGVLPIDTAMLPSLKTLGYAEVALAGDSLWGHAGDVCRGHEFHYSEIVADDSRADGWRPAYAVRRRHTGGVVAEGFAKGRLLASYIHLHWASRPQVVDRFIACCQGEKHE